ncbi:MAG TPA: AmmeMemoRadiSam system radical SAM enzyme [bacterium]|nr:AmmeMemoRadiSam system radical SAM enzyme [bacterium]
MKSNIPKKLAKREFLKYGLAGLGGMACSMSPLKLFAGPFREADNVIDGIGYANDIRNIKPSDELWKWSKECMYYTETPRGLRCKVCPNDCDIKPNEVGDCKTRLSKNGKLYTLVYGNPCAIHVDPIEKKPLYHFLPASRAFSIATAGCNLVCLNCQNWEISQKSPKETKNFDLMPSAVVEQCISRKCESIAYTYSEPLTFYEYTHDTAKLAKAKGIKNVLVSAGYIYEEPLRKLCKYIDAANIDLKSFKDSIYEKLNGVKLEPILKTLKIMKEENVWLEITNLIIPSWTDDLVMIKEMCDWLYKNGLHECPLHFSRFRPLYKLTQLPSTPVSTLDKARKIALDAGIKYVYIGNVPGNLAENTYCYKCKKIVIERKGYRIISNNIENNSCKFCKEKIAGVWK